MRVNGRKLEGPNVETLVIPRPVLEDGASGDIVFKARAISSFDEFEVLVPRPTPPMVQPRGGEPYADTKDKKYQAKVLEYVKRKTEFTVLKSLSESPGLEWETVDLEKPDTWSNYIPELREAGFSDAELNKIMDLVTSANGMDEDKYKEARNRFLLGQGRSADGSPSQDIAPVSTPSSVPANGSA